MQFGATKLKRTASKQSKPHPSQAARSTVHCVRSMSRNRGRDIAAVVMLETVADFARRGEQG